MNNNKDDIYNKSTEIRDMVEKQHPFPVISLSMNKAQVLESLQDKKSIYNTPEMVDWLEKKIFEHDVTIDDDYIERIENKFKRIRMRYVKTIIEDVLDEH